MKQDDTTKITALYIQTSVIHQLTPMCYDVNFVR